MSPLKATRQVLIGKITGDYRYEPEAVSTEYPSVRNVQWLKKVSRDEQKESQWSRTPRHLYGRKEIKLKQPPDFDVILIDSPNHMGGPTGSIKKSIKELGRLDVKGKYAAVFDTYMAKDYEKAVKKTEKQTNDKVPELRLLTGGEQRAGSRRRGMA